MGRFEEIPDEPAPAPAAAGPRFAEVPDSTPLDPRGRPYDPRFAPEDEDKTPAQKRTFAAAPDLTGQIQSEKDKVNALHFGRAADNAGFFERAFRSAAQGANALGTVGADVINTRGAALAEPEKRRQLARGIDDIATLGYGQKLAARVGNALGDKPEEALGPETFGGTAGDTTLGLGSANGGAPVANTQAADQAAAPEYRTAGQFLGGMTGAGKVIGKGAGKLVGGILPEAVPAALRGGTEGVLGYELSAPAMAGLSANSEGRRLEAIHEAATDPLGILMSTGGGAIGEGGASAVKKSKGAKARELIEREGQGAEVSPFSAAKGGVFDQELKGLPANDRGVGQAAKIGATQIADTIEQQFHDEHGFGYREGPGVIKDANSLAREQARGLRRQARAADIAYRDDVAAAKDAVKTETAARAKEILGNIDSEHRVETSEPYRVLKGMIDNSTAARAPRDVAPIVASMQDAVNDLETAPFARSQLVEQLKILENYRDPNTGAIMVPERQLNGLRRTLARSAKVGMSDAPGEAEAPLRRAAFVAKQMVDEGPYAALNKLYAEGSAKREGARSAVGLPGKPSKSAAADAKRLTGNLRQLVGDETAVPGPLPEGFNPRALRAALKAPEARREAALSKIRAQLAASEKGKQATIDRVAEAQKGAEADRAMLGLNTKIGTRKTDVNQIRLALQRQGENTGTAGGSAGAEDALAQYLAAHPEARASAALPELQRAKADLSFRLVPHHGGLTNRTVGATVGAGILGALAHGPLASLAVPAYLAAQNAKAISGRLLYPIAQRTSGAGIGAGLGSRMGAASSPEDIALAQAIQRHLGEGMSLPDAVVAARGDLAPPPPAAP